MNSDLYHLQYSDYCHHHYTPNVSAVMSFGLFQVFYGELESIQKTTNRNLYLIHGVRLYNKKNADSSLNIP